jgi:hypothetical protein
MSGFMGFGQSGGEKQGISNLQNLIGFGTAAGQSGENAGMNTLDQAKGALAAPTSYWQGILAPGRTAAATNAAPATNAVQQQTDAQRNQEAAQGTGRGGGTAAANREASTSASKAIDDIINQNMIGGRQAAATGLTGAAGTEAGIGGAQASNAGQLLGLTGAAGASELGNAVSKINSQGADFSQIFSSLL